MKSDRVVQQYIHSFTVFKWLHAEILSKPVTRGASDSTEICYVYMDFPNVQSMLPHMCYFHAYFGFSIYSSIWPLTNGLKSVIMQVTLYSL